jgi:hypothetical protein
LLQLLGHPLTENDRLTDLEFLSDVMEVQEDLASCDVAALRAHAQRNGDSMKQQRALASQAFASGRIADAKAVVIKLQCGARARALFVWLLCHDVQPTHRCVWTCSTFFLVSFCDCFLGAGI